jgi:DNA-binding CsgD family transcriptional regulator/tetratricopeptide (TPR) repeat protein
VRLLERARREPCQEPALALALGRAYRLMGRLPSAVAELEAARACWPLGPQRDEITRDLATSLAMDGRGEEAVALLEREMALLPAQARERRLLLAAQLGLGILLDALVVDASARIEREAAALTGQTSAERLLLDALALIRARTGEFTATDAAADSALRGEHLVRDQSPETFLFTFVALVLLAADRDVDAERWLERGAAEARSRGAEMMLGIAELGLARVHRFRGELAASRASLTLALERALLGSRYGRIIAGGTLVATLVECGALDDGDRLLAELGLEDGPLPDFGAATTLLRSRMLLHSRRHRHAEALADADELLSRLDRRGHRAPGPLGEAACVFFAAGDVERARREAVQELERARRWDTPSAVGLATGQLGKILGGAPGLALLEQAVGTPRATPCRLELAKAQLALGAARRRRNRRAQARDPLRRALDLAEGCGAVPVIDAARVELQACGGRPRRALLSGPDSLTASERRVAELAAQGLSNPEIARALVVARSTVESHLRASYRKLDVNGRRSARESPRGSRGFSVSPREKFTEAHGCEAAVDRPG